MRWRKDGGRAETETRGSPAQPRSLNEGQDAGEGLHPAPTSCASGFPHLSPASLLSQVSVPHTERVPTCSAPHPCPPSADTISLVGCSCIDTTTRLHPWGGSQLPLRRFCLGKRRLEVFVSPSPPPAVVTCHPGHFFLRVCVSPLLQPWEDSMVLATLWGVMTKPQAAVLNWLNYRKTCASETVPKAPPSSLHITCAPAGGRLW